MCLYGFVLLVFGVVALCIKDNTDLGISVIYSKGGRCHEEMDALLCTGAYAVADGLW